MINGEMLCVIQRARGSLCTANGEVLLSGEGLDSNPAVCLSVRVGPLAVPIQM